MRRFILLIISFSMLSISMTYAQSFTLRGNVFDSETKEPLIGASIIEKGTTNGVTADFDGNYSLEINGDNAIVQISYIGYKSVEKAVSDSAARFDVAMQSDTHMVDEVVVVAY